MTRKRSHRKVFGSRGTRNASAGCPISIPASHFHTIRTPIAVERSEREKELGLKGREIYRAIYVNPSKDYRQ